MTEERTTPGRPRVNETTGERLVQISWRHTEAVANAIRAVAAKHGCPPVGVVREALAAHLEQQQTKGPLSPAPGNMVEMGHSVPASMYAALVAEADERGQGRRGSIAAVVREAVDNWLDAHAPKST